MKNVILLTLDATRGVIAVILGGLGLIVVMIAGLFVTAIQYRRGRQIPIWAESLVAKED